MKQLGAKSQTRDSLGRKRLCTSDSIGFYFILIEAFNNCRCFSGAALVVDSY